MLFLVISEEPKGDWVEALCVIISLLVHYCYVFLMIVNSSHLFMY